LRFRHEIQTEKNNILLLSAMRTFKTWYVFIFFIFFSSTGLYSELWRPGLYAFQNGIEFGSFEDEAKVLKELGYDGVTQVKKGGSDLAERIKVYEKYGLKVGSIYLPSSEQAVSADTIRPLENRGATIDLTVAKITPEIIDSIRKTASVAESMHIRVAIYPHHGLAIATISQALDLVKEVNHPNVGVAFNLCHFLRSESVESLENIIKEAGPKIFTVSTSGGDVSGKDWEDFIKTLDQGNFSQIRLFKALKEIGFNGVVGLQCYRVAGDKKDNLKKSIQAWQEIIKALESDF
jgi:sugar phosphate isomerase/epimerase